VQTYRAQLNCARYDASVLDHSDLDLDAQLCFPLYAATRAVTRVYTDVLSNTGLTYPQYLSMLALWGAEEPMTVGELGRRLELDSGTLTPLLKRLEARGVVARRRDPRDERRVLIEVTDAGRALRDDVAPVPRALANALSLTRGEATELRRLLAKVVDGLPDA
jgi:DNA-binding MarR family transcriptional regulator